MPLSRIATHDLIAVSGALDYVRRHGAHVIRSEALRRLASACCGPPICTLGFPFPRPIGSAS